MITSSGFVEEVTLSSLFDVLSMEKDISLPNSIITQRAVLTCYGSTQLEQVKGHPEGQTLSLKCLHEKRIFHAGIPVKKNRERPQAAT